MSPGTDDWLLARERGESFDAPAEDRALYARLERSIAELPDQPAPAGLDDRVLAGVDGVTPLRPRRVRTALLIAAPLAAAAVILFVLLSRDGGGAPRGLEIGIRKGEVVQRSTSAALGDILVVSVPPGAELTVQRNDATVVASCPGHPACRDDGGRLVLELELTIPGRYRAILLRDGKVIETSTPVEVR